MASLEFFEEPKLLFRYDQGMEDPRDGLSLFGPLDKGKPHGLRAGVVGTREGLRRFRDYVKRIQLPIVSDARHRNRPVFPGFEAIYGIPWNPVPHLEREINETELLKRVNLDDRHIRVFQTVDLFAGEILDAHGKDDEKADVWFLVVPDILYQNCRPRSFVGKFDQVKAEGKIGLRTAKKLRVQPDLFSEQNAKVTPYLHDPDFHNQIKARLLQDKIPTQLLRESTIAFREFKTDKGELENDLTVLESEIAWNISSAVFYKAGGKPWKLRSIRPGVCYIGLVFKRIDRDPDPKTACCAAQIFLDSGDGVVFKGDVGPWYNPERGNFHLSNQEAAKQLISTAIETYKRDHDNQPPQELFIHGKTRFNDVEWAGFQSAGGKDTAVVGIRITSDPDLRVYHNSKTPILRGMAWIQNPKLAFLWTRGFIPRLKTYPGREVPRPLRVELNRGEAEMGTVLKDILALTKLNYNSCHFADGVPVTLRFADAVGEILVSGPPTDNPPLPFKYYI